MSKPDKDNLPRNFPRFSALTNQVEQPISNFNTGLQNTSFTKTDRSFQGMNRKSEGGQKMFDEELFSTNSLMDEQSVNILVNKEITNERGIILNYVNTSLNSNTDYVKEVCRKIKEDREKEKDLFDGQINMLRSQIDQLQSEFKDQLQQLSDTIIYMVNEKSLGADKLAQNFHQFQQDFYKREQNENPQIQKILKQQEVSSAKTKMDEEFMNEIQKEVQTVKVKISEIQKGQNISSFNSNQSTEIQSELSNLKSQLNTFKGQLEQKEEVINSQTKQLLQSSQEQERGKINEIHKYLNTFSKVVSAKLNITNEDLKLFPDDNSKGFNPFSFGANNHLIQTEPSNNTIGTMQSAEFEIKDNNKLIIKKETGSPFSTVSKQNNNEQQPLIYSQQQQQQSQLPQQFQSQQGQLNQKNCTINDNINLNVYNSNNSDYYNIYQENNSAQFGILDISKNNTKKKKRIFGDDASLPRGNPPKQDISTPQRGEQNPSFFKSFDDSNPLSSTNQGENYMNISQKGQFLFKNVSNEEALNQDPALDSHISLKTNNLEEFDGGNGHSDSESEEHSQYSNFRLKETKSLFERELIQNKVTTQIIDQNQLIQQQAPSSHRQQQSTLIQNQYLQSTTPISLINNQLPPITPASIASFKESYTHNSSISPKGNSRVINSLSGEIQFQLPSNQISSISTSANHIPPSSVHQNFNKKIEDSTLIKEKKLDTIVEQDLEQTNHDFRAYQYQNQDNQIQFKLNPPITSLNQDQMRKSKPKISVLSDPEKFENNQQPTAVTGKALNFMISSKGRNSLRSSLRNADPETSQIKGGSFEQDNLNFNPKWGYDSQASVSSFKEEVEYQLDEEGYLLDEKGNFLLDDNGEKIKLSDENIKYLQQNHMIQD